LLQCVQLYAIDIDNDAVSGRYEVHQRGHRRGLVSIRSVHTAIAGLSRRCYVLWVRCGRGQGCKWYRRHPEREEDAEEAVLEEGTCKSGTGEDVSEDVGEDAVGVVLEEGIHRSGIGEDCEEGVNRDVGGNTDGEEIRSSQEIMFSSESPESLMDLDNTVLALEEAVDSALVNSGQFVKENLVRISDAEVYDGTTPVAVLKDNREVCKVRGVRCRSEGTETQGNSEEGIGNSELPFRTLAPMRSS
jgi:hypothetical protein